MEANVNNPHDHFFRYSFSQPEEARVFLAHFLPPELVQLLELDGLTLESGSYIDEKLREHLTDILYTVPLRSGKMASIYCLFEHKSYPEPGIHLQILRYSYERWQSDTQDGQGWRPIVAIVFYHGKRKWTIPSRFLDCFGDIDPLLHRFVPNFEYILIDTSQYADDALRQVESGALQASLFLLKYIYDESLSAHLGDVIQPLTQVSQNKVLDVLWALLTYLTSATDTIGEAELRATLTDVFQEAEEIMMTIAEKWRLEGEEIGIRKGEEIGIRKGEEIGIRKGKQDTILQILESRFGPMGEEVTMLVERCDVNLLDELVDLTLGVETLDEFVLRLSELQPPDEVAPADEVDSEDEL